MFNTHFVDFPLWQLPFESTLAISTSSQLPSSRWCLNSAFTTTYLPSSPGSMHSAPRTSCLGHVFPYCYSIDDSPKHHTSPSRDAHNYEGARYFSDCWYQKVQQEGQPEAAKAIRRQVTCPSRAMRAAARIPREPGGPSLVTMSCRTLQFSMMVFHAFCLSFNVNDVR